MFEIGGQEKYNRRISIDNLSDQINPVDIENVYIYVADAVRLDFLPSKISDRGTSIKTVASSTSSAPSFASMLSGLYPSSHGVYDFGNQIPESITTLHDFENVFTAFYNSIKDDPTAKDPIYPMQGIEPSAQGLFFGTVDEPFLIMERGPGGHAPYNGIGDADPNYFDSLSSRTRREIKEMYRTKVRMDEERFLDRLSELDDCGLSDDTLVVYTSDHGELLGEGGMLGHNGPMRPELVYVPTVFINPNIEQATVVDGILQHVDLLPTVARKLDISIQSYRFDGKHLDALKPDKAGLCVARNKFKTELSPEWQLSFEGVWDTGGGHMFSQSSLIERAGILMGKLAKSPKKGYLRKNLSSVIPSYLWPKKIYGDPRPRSEAEKFLPDSYAKPGEYVMSEDEKDHLRDLGYLQ